MIRTNNRQAVNKLLFWFFLAASNSACDTANQKNTDKIASPTITPSAYPDSNGTFSVDLRKYAVKQPEPIVLNDSLAYPERDPLKLKAIQTDGWTPQKFIDANTGGVAMNFVWQNWQPNKVTRKCNKAEIAYDGNCFLLLGNIEKDIKYWSSNGVAITAVLWGVPEWARIGESCRMPRNGMNQFCANKNPADFGRFAGMLANRYDGRNGKGRIADFVIHNEVNMSSWFNPGCGQGVACDIDDWVDTYAVDYNAAFDRIKQHQPAAKVFVPFAHQFGSALDQPAANLPIISVQTFLSRFNLAAMGRQWRVAYHPYNKNGVKPEFSTDDLPHVSFGNIGVLASWLRSEFPEQPEAWEIHLTESGFNSLEAHSSQAAQAKSVCDSFRNVLATPGIENYVYHRMQDHPAETGGGGGFGLFTEDKAEKPAWRVWAGANGGNGEALDCGFENVPYVKLTQYIHSSRKNRTSSRIVPAGYQPVESWRLLRSYQRDTVMVYECVDGNGSYTTLDISCGGTLNLGPVGYSFAEEQEHTLPLFSCQAGGIHNYNSSDPTCGEGSVREFLGYVYQ